MKNGKGTKHILNEKVPAVKLAEYDEASTKFSQARAMIRTTYDALSTPSEIDREAMNWVLLMALEKLSDVKDVFDRLECDRSRLK